MNKKIIFFDVDGTLVDVRPAREYVPESTIKAVRETRKKGNLCFLCTGRSLAEIYPHILDIGFDGIIGAGGGFVTIGDEMLYHKKVSNKDVHRVVDFFEENDYDYYLESNGGLFASENLVSRLEKITYGDLEELYYLTDYYLKHEEERKCIAANGLERVKKDFRFEDRMRKMIEDVL